MKRMISKIAITGFVLSLLAAVSVGQSKATSKKGCSVASLNGAYGFYRTGTKNGEPLVAFGIVDFDGAGNSSFRQTIRVDGETTEDFFTSGATDATYEVHSNCAVKLIDSTGFVFGEAVVVDGGNEAYFLSLTDGATISGVMKKIG